MLLIFGGYIHHGILLIILGEGEFERSFKGTQFCVRIGFNFEFIP